MECKATLVLQDDSWQLRIAVPDGQTVVLVVGYGEIGTLIAGERDVPCELLVRMAPP